MNFWSFVTLFCIFVSYASPAKVSKQLCEMDILENGLRIVTCSHIEKEDFSVRLAVRAGDSSNSYAGIAHLTEHCIATNPEYEEALLKEKRATTGYESTNYSFTCKETKLLRNLHLLANLFIKPNINKYAVQREVVPVDVEWHLKKHSLESIHERLASLFMSSLNPLSIFETGSKKAYKEIEQSTGKSLEEVVWEFYHSHYSSDKMTLVIEGPIDSVKDLREAAQGIFSRVPFFPTLSRDLNYELYLPSMKDNLLLAAAHGPKMVFFQWIFRIVRRKVDKPNMVRFADVMRNIFYCNEKTMISWIDDEHLQVVCICNDVDYRSATSLKNKCDEIKKTLQEIEPRRLFPILSTNVVERIALTAHFMDDAAFFPVKVDGKSPLHPQQYLAIKSIADQLSLETAQVIAFDTVLDEEAPILTEPYTETLYQWQPKYMVEHSIIFDFGESRSLAEAFTRHLVLIKLPQWTSIQGFDKPQQTVIKNEIAEKLLQTQSSVPLLESNFLEKFLFPFSFANVAKVNVVCQYSSGAIRLEYIRDKYMESLSSDSDNSPSLPVSDHEGMIKVVILANYSYDHVFGRNSEVYLMALRRYLEQFAPEIIVSEEITMERLTIYFPKSMSTMDIMDYLLFGKGVPDFQDLWSKVYHEIINFSIMQIRSIKDPAELYATLFSFPQPVFLETFSDPIISEITIDKLRSIAGVHVHKGNIQTSSQELKAALIPSHITYYQLILPGNPTLYCPDILPIALNHVSIVFHFTKDKSFPFISEHLSPKTVSELFVLLFSRVFHVRFRYQEALDYTPDYLLGEYGSIALHVSSRKSPVVILEAFRKFFNDIPAIFEKMDDLVIKKCLKKVKLNEAVIAEALKHVKAELKSLFAKQLSLDSQYARFVAIQLWRERGRDSTIERNNHIKEVKEKGYLVIEKLEDYPRAKSVVEGIEDMDIKELFRL